jgi:superfamily II DNA or RNA helicase
VSCADLDEVHHCGGERAWAAGLRTAFEPASCRLLLSGTPFRSDNDEIPFVTYVDGVGRPDVSYGYGQALREGVIRAIFYPRRGGLMEWDGRDGRRRPHSFDDELIKTDARRRLRTAISGLGEWLPAVLREAHTRLTELRAEDPTAGGIVFADNVAAAEEIGQAPAKPGRPRRGRRGSTLRDARVCAATTVPARRASSIEPAR